MGCSCKLGNLGRCMGRSHLILCLGQDWLSGQTGMSAGTSHALTPLMIQLAGPQGCEPVAVLVMRYRRPSPISACSRVQHRLRTLAPFKPTYQVRAPGSADGYSGSEHTERSWSCKRATDSLCLRRSNGIPTERYACIAGARFSWLSPAYFEGMQAALT